MLKMKHSYRKKANPKVIALIVEISIFSVGMTILSILYYNKVEINYIPVLVATLILLFAIVLTLSRIRYEALRDIRADGTFKQTNLPLYTDETTLIGHDMKDEHENR